MCEQKIYFPLSDEQKLGLKVLEDLRNQAPGYAIDSVDDPEEFKAMYQTPPPIFVITININ